MSEIFSHTPIVHETHRGKALFAAHISKSFLKSIPYLKLTLDISHWVNVAESFLEDQEEAVNLAISKTNHIHCRIGHTEGSQITDPRLKHWEDVTKIFFDWWDRTISEKKKEKLAVLTITPEFGPLPYMTLLPDGRPFMNQREVNRYIMERIKKRYVI